MSEIVYKALNPDGTSPYQNYQWEIPKPGRKGKWLSIADDPILCHRGLHGYLTREIAESEHSSCDIYEMEVDGKIVRDKEKVAASRARLIRKLPESEPELLEMGIQDCMKCGKPHGKYRFPRTRHVSWADRVDGHSYNPEPWEQMIARIPDFHGVLEAAKALTKQAIIDEREMTARDRNTMAGGTWSYNPVVPAYHAFKSWTTSNPGPHPELCGTCGLIESLHDGWEEREALAKEFEHCDRWELILAIQDMRRRK